MVANATLRRKIEQSRVTISSFPKLNVLAASHARETAARVRSLFNTVADVKNEASAVIRAGRYLRGLPSPSVLAILDINGVPNAAAFHMEPELVSHVVDLSMGGDPATDSCFPNRLPTNIDLELCSRFIDSVLAAFDYSVRMVCKNKSMGAMKCARFEMAPNMANIAPERSEVLIINQRVEMGEANRIGFFELVLPLSVIDPVKGELMEHFGSPSNLNSGIWERHLRRSLMESDIRIDAVIDRQTLPLGQLSSLQPGDVIALGCSVDDPLDLTLDTRCGREVIARCKLGAKGVVKAVKLIEEAHEDILRQLRLEG